MGMVGPVFFNFSFSYFVTSAGILIVDRCNSYFENYIFMIINVEKTLIIIKVNGMIQSTYLLVKHKFYAT